MLCTLGVQVYHVCRAGDDIASGLGGQGMGLRGWVRKEVRGDSEGFQDTGFASSGDSKP